MSFSSSSPYCPQCGAAGCRPVAGRPDLYNCAECLARFSYSRGSDGLQIHLQSGDVSAQAAQTALLRHLKWLAPLVLGLLALGWMLPPLVNMLKRESASPLQAVEQRGSIEAATVVDHNGQPVYIRVLEQRNADAASYAIVATELASGKPLGEPQFINLPGTGGSRPPQLRRFSDGQWYLVLRENRFLRLEPGTLRFTDITPALAERFPQALGKGVVRIAIERPDRPDSLEVTASDGGKFYVHWLTGQVVAYGNSSKAYEQAMAGYSQQRSGYRYVSLPRPTGEEDRALLVQFWSRYEPGKMEHYGYFDLVPSGSAEVRESPRSYVEVGSGYSTRPYAIKDFGLIRIEAVAPQTPRFHASVMGENDSRVLLAYNPTPMRDSGRVLQLLDKASNQIVWSRTTDQIAQLGTREGGAYTSGIAVSGGFLLFRDGRTPAVLIDNQGVVVHDFTAGSQSKR